MNKLAWFLIMGVLVSSISLWIKVMEMTEDAVEMQHQIVALYMDMPRTKR